MMTRFLIAVALTPLLLAAECQRPAPIPIPSTGGSSFGGASGGSSSGGALPSSGGAGGSASVTECGRACARLRELSCPSAKPTASGATCEDVCENVNASRTLHIDTACVVGAPSCAVADRCVW
jgi:hypothetical protein